MRMFWHFFRLEWRFAWRTGLPAILFLIAGAATVTVLTHLNFGGLYPNAPMAIEWVHAFFGAGVSLALAAVFFVPAAVRDFAARTDELVFSAPVDERSYYTGRFAGVFAVALVAALGISVGILVAPLIPWRGVLYGPVNWGAHRMALVMFTLPNLFIAGACSYAFASWVRHPFTGLGAAVALLVIGYGVPHVLIDVIPDHRWAAMADPFGFTSLKVILEKWGPASGAPQDQYVTLRGLMLWNRCAWVALSAGVFALAYRRCDYRRRLEKSKAKAAAAVAPIPFRAVTTAGNVGPAQRWIRQWLSIVRIDLKGIVREPLFLIVAVGLFAQACFSFWGRLTAAHLYWKRQLPTSPAVLANLEDGFTPLFVIILALYGGYFVWRERSERVHELKDSLAVPESAVYGAKLFSLAMLIGGMMAIATATGIIVQLILGGHPDLGLYAIGMGLQEFPFYFTLAVGAIAIQAVCPGKYFGYVACAAILGLTSAIWIALDIRSGLVIFAYRPFESTRGLISWSGWFWFNLYWLWWSGLLAIFAILVWPRGVGEGWRRHLREARVRFTFARRCAAAVLAVGVIATGGVIYYNISILNGWKTRRENEALAVAYEKAYGQYAALPQPVVTDVDCAVDLFPDRRGFALKGTEWLENRTGGPVGELHFTLSRESSVEVPAAYLKVDDRQLGYCVYRLFTPMQPGERRQITLHVGWVLRGFENDTSHNRLRRDATFLDWTMFPTLGYSTAHETRDRDVRAKAGLLGRSHPNPLPNPEGNPAALLNTTVTLSTAPNQIAIAPGALEREWTESGRRYFRYRSQQGVIRSFALSSADYLVARAEAAGTKLALYYRPDSAGNIAVILRAAEDSVEYYTRHIGPCPQKEIRLVEVAERPWQDLTAATPGTVFISENDGFQAKPAAPGTVDPLRYLIACQLVQQWWGHDIGRDPVDTRWVIDTVQQYAALQIAADGRFEKAALEWTRWTRAENLTSAPTPTRLGKWSALGGLGLLYLGSVCGHEALEPVLTGTFAAMRAPTAPAWGIRAFETALNSRIAPEKRYLIAHVERDLVPLTIELRSAVVRARADGSYQTDVRLRVERSRMDENGRSAEPVSGSARLSLFGPAQNARSAPPQSPLSETTVDLTQTWMNVSLVSATRPAFVASSDDFDDFFVYDRTVFVRAHARIPVTEGDRR
jgi:ABC-2 type transport system permease protein